MTLEELGTRYLRLRAELASAYEAPVWDSLRIDGLTDAIAATESAIAASGAPEAFTFARSHGSASGAVAACC